MSAYRAHKISISLDIPRLLLKYVAGLGVEVDDLRRQLGLDEADVLSPTSRLSIEKIDGLWKTVMERVQDPLFGLHFGEAVASSWGGHILFAVMVNSATLEAALERFCRYHGLLASGAAPRLCDVGANRAFVLEQMDMLGDPYAESILAMLNVTISRLAERQICPKEVHFVHSAPADDSEYRRIFGASLMFDQPDYRLVLDRALLDAPIFLADRALLDYLEQFARRALSRLTMVDSWTGRVSEIMGKLLLQGEKPHLATVAARLTISSRQLQNKLQAEGITYQKLLDMVRQRMAQDCLKQEGMTICDVAFLLGFSEQSAFNRAFKRWTGMTPLQYSSSGSNA